jgi:hypothetical protein
VQLTGHSLSGLADVQLGALKVHVGPAKPEQLTPPQAGRQRQDVHGQQPVTCGSDAMTVRITGRGTCNRGYIGRVVTDGRSSGPGEWVLLTYQLPREPSTPRIALWRRLRRLGVAQLGDGLAALPADARTREQLEWLAEEVVEAGGEAGVWLARPASAAQERALAAGMTEARAAEYLALAEEAAAQLASGTDRTRVVERLRRQWREITRRDYFPPPQRDAAAAVVQALTRQASSPASAEVHLP